jgi:CO/xanthine dehydrogenase Mo-binding subunit
VHLVKFLFYVFTFRFNTDQQSIYLIPNVMDAPPGLERYLIERHDPCGPYGMKGVREFSFFPAALAFNSAIR